MRVRKFAQTQENIYSFHLRRLTACAKQFTCGGPVVMSEKHSQSARAGSGQYDWSFAKAAPRLAAQFTITIQVMQLLASAEPASVLGWVQGLSDPKCSARQVARAAPGGGLLVPALRHLTAYESDA